MPPSLERIFSFHVVLNKEDTLTLGPTKGGACRVIVPLSSGFLKGPGINADLVQGGADWASIDTAAGIAHLDGRLQFRDNQTNDVFFVRVSGISHLDAKSQLALEFSPEAKSTKAEDHYWFATPIIEVSGENHKWMEQCWFVSQGHWEIPGDGTHCIEHDIYKLLAK